MCLPNSYSIRFSSILFDSGFKTRILSISKLSSSKKASISQFGNNIEACGSCKKKALALHSGRDSVKMSNVTSKDIQSGAEVQSRCYHGSNMDSVDMLDGQISASVAFAMNNFSLLIETHSQTEKTCKHIAVTTGGAVRVHSCSG